MMDSLRSINLKWTVRRKAHDRQNTLNPKSLRDVGPLAPPRAGGRIPKSKICFLKFLFFD